MSVVLNPSASFISEAEKCPILCVLCFLCLSACSNVSPSLPELVLKGLKCTWEFRCLCGTLVGVPLDLMDILACFVCLFLFVDLCTVFHSHCSILYPHIFSVFCACISLLFSDIGNIPVGHSCAPVEDVLSRSVYVQLCSLLSLLLFRRPLHMLKMSQLPEPTGVTDAC